MLINGLDNVSDFEVNLNQATGSKELYPQNLI
jgi:hypothetical protein